MLEVGFSDGFLARLPAEYLRVESPSAEVQGHAPAQRQLVTGKRHVGIARIEPTGNYAIRLIFSDGHETGIFSWEYLHRLGREHAQRWAAYEKRLAEAAQSREA